VTELPVELGVAALLGVGFLATARGELRRVAFGLGWIVVANLAITAGYHVLDIEPFFLPSTWALAVVSPLGLDALLDRVGAVKLARLTPIALGLALVPVNFANRDLSAHALARVAAEDTLLAAPENALVLVDGDTSIHALWYLQGVENARPDVIVLSPGHTSGWYLDALEARYPAEPWPSHAGETLDPSRHTRSVLRAFAGHRPLFATPSVPLDAYGAGGGGDRLGSMPHGLGVILLEVGTSIEIDELASFSDDYFDQTMTRVLPMPRVVDVDSASLYLEYALSMSRAADLVAERHPDVAARLYQRVFVMFPDDLDRMVRDDVMRGLGREIPSLELGAHVATELAELLPRIEPPE
jgi:hypothetical protein